MSLNDDSESNVREGRSEGDIMKKGRCCFLIGLAVVEHGLNLCVHACVLALVLKFVFGMHSCTCDTIELSWQMMRTWEETQTESESN